MWSRPSWQQTPSRPIGHQKETDHELALGARQRPRRASDSSLPMLMPKLAPAYGECPSSDLASLPPPSTTPAYLAIDEAGGGVCDSRQQVGAMP